MDEAAPESTLILDDVCDEGVRLAKAAADARLPLRLMGGVAVWARCPTSRLPALRRVPADVDFVGWSKARHETAEFFDAQGYEADKLFNALHGAQRLNFLDPVRDRPIDVILDRFAMCHSIDLRDRLLLEPLTIPATDLLLTKLQIVELNDKDVRDLVAMLADLTVDTDRLTSLLGADWGFEHTARRTLERVDADVARYDLPPPVGHHVRDTIAGIVAALDKAPKTLGWRMRSSLGERIRWYQVPEEGRR